MDTISVVIAERLKELNEKISDLTRKKDALIIKRDLYKYLGQIHEKTPIWEFLIHIKGITTTLNKSLEDESK